MNNLILSDYEFVKYINSLLFFATISYWKNLLFPKVFKSFNFSKILILVSNFSIGLILLIRWFTQNYFPLSNLYESLLFLTWSISFIHLLIENKTKSILIGCIGTPIEFLLMSFSSYLPIELQKASPLVPSLQSNWLMMHVSTMMISYSLLLIGSLLSIFYLLFNYSQKKGISIENSKLLQTIDIWSYRIIGFGFPCLTIGIISGAVWANEAWGSYWSWDPKETWAFITWIVFASYLHTRLLKNWKNEKSSIIGSIGFFVIWICYLGVNFLAKGLHTYGWIIN
jgi:cytochrome c-type biogenesis protein CcsB